MTRSPPSRHRSHVSRLRRTKPTRLLLQRRSRNPKHAIRTGTGTLAYLHAPTRVPAQSITRAELLLLRRSTTHLKSLWCALKRLSSPCGTLCMPPGCAVVRLRCPSRRRPRRSTDTTARKSHRRRPAMYRLRQRCARTAGGSREESQEIVELYISVVGG